jgi:hypothetical protein
VEVVGMVVKRFTFFGKMVIHLIGIKKTDKVKSPEDSDKKRRRGKNRNRDGKADNADKAENTENTNNTEKTENTDNKEDTAAETSAEPSDRKTTKTPKEEDFGGDRKVRLNSFILFLYFTSFLHPIPTPHVILF